MKMSEVPVDSELSIHRIEGFSKVKVDLNEEWFLEFFVLPQKNRSSFIERIQLNRTTQLSDEKLNISGELKIILNGNLIWEQKFTKFTNFGSSFEYICPFRNRLILRNLTYNLSGVLVIKENNKESHIVSTESTNAAEQETAVNGDAKKCIHFKFLENGESKEEILQNCFEKLSKDMEKLLNPETSSFADVTLKCGNTSILAHKNILSARSPVFEKMFSYPMKEGRKNKVDITDIDESALQALMIYIYTGKTSDLTVLSATKLLFAADKYQILDLKSLCFYFLKSEVSLKNVLEILVSGDVLIEDLKLFALEYICNNCAKFSVLEKTEEWKTLQKERPTLAMEVLLSLVKSKEEKSKGN